MSPSFTNTYSLAFDGVDDFVKTSLDGTSTGGILAASDSDVELTISFWFKVNNTSSGEGIWQYANQLTDTSPFIIFRTSSGPDRVRFYIDNQYQALQVINLSQWYHVLLTRTSSDNTWRGYLDGNATPWFTKDDGGTISNRASATDIYLGNGYNGYAPCSIDEFAVWNSVQDASTIYNGGVPNDLTSLNPVAWYRNGDNGTFKSPQWLIPNNSNKDKVSNYSFSYDGIDDFVDVGTGLNSSLELGDTFSFSAWLKFSADNTERTILSNATGSNLGFQFRITNSETVRLILIQSGTVYFFQDSSVLSVDTWHHIAATYDGSGDENGINLYIDGALDNSTNGSAGSVSTITSSSPLYIGRYYSGQFYEGNIDEVAIFNTALSSTNVASIYNSGTPTTITGAVAHWRMGEDATFNTNWTVPDQVGSSDGTSANMTIEDRVGDASNSSNNSVSFNMDEVDRETDVPS